MWSTFRWRGRCEGDGTRHGSVPENADTVIEREIEHSVDTDSSPTSELHTGALPERLFPRLTPQQIARVATHGRRRPTAAAEVLVDTGDKAIPFFVVLSGEIQAVRASMARRR